MKGSVWCGTVKSQA